MLPLTWIKSVMQKPETRKTRSQGPSVDSIFKDILQNIQLGTSLDWLAIKWNETFW